MNLVGLTVSMAFVLLLAVYVQRQLSTDSFHDNADRIYVVNKDGNKAVKREIRIGRQNPQYYEVLEGLEPGEKVITSGYETYGDSDVLVF